MKNKFGFILLFVLVFGLLSCLSVSAQEKKVELPDYTKWEKKVAKTATTYNGKSVEILSESYMHINDEATEGELVVVSYNPETNQPWFATYIKAYHDDKKKDEIYLFEFNEQKKWILVKPISDFDELQSIMESRYHIG